jgi:hypothetical protein
MRLWYSYVVGMKDRPHKKGHFAYVVHTESD